MTQQQIHLRANRQRRLQKQIKHCEDSIQIITQGAARIGSEPPQSLIDAARVRINSLTKLQSSLA